MNILESLKNSIDQCLVVSYPTSYLILFCMINISFIFKDHTHNEVFDKFKNKWKINLKIFEIYACIVSCSYCI